MSLPVLYPSGAGATVEIQLGSGKCQVSDMGMGHDEAMLANAAELYDSCARDAAERFGIAFDGISIFMARVGIERFEGAIVAVANASVQASAEALTMAGSESDRPSRR